MVQIHGNQDMQKLFSFILMLYSFAYASESEVEIFSYVHEAKALVSDTEIVAGNTIRLKIRANGDKVVFPNIEEIDAVPVLEQKEIVVNRPHYINGVMKKERTILILTFAPHHDVTIPSYEVEIDGKIYKTKAIKIKVVPANAQNNEDNNKFFLHLRTDKKSVIVGEPVLVSVYLSLKNGLRLSDTPQYTQPLFKGFFSKILGDEKIYAEGNRQVTELKYLLIPQSEGTFHVGPAKVKIGVPNNSRRDMFGRIISTTWIPIVSNTIKVNVIRKPQESDLVGQFSVEYTLDNKKVKSNKPVNFTLKITGDGTLEDFEFPEYEIDGVTVYSDDAEITAVLNHKIVQSTYTKSFVFISDRNFTIPSCRISMYDVESKTVKYLEVPSYTVEVEGSKAFNLQKSNVEISHDGRVYRNVKIPQKSMLESEEIVKLSHVSFVPWWMMVLAFILGMLVMYLLLHLFRIQRKKGTVTESEALKLLYTRLSTSKEVEDMVRKLYAKKQGDDTIVIDSLKLKTLVEKYKT